MSYRLLFVTVFLFAAGAVAGQRVCPPIDAAFRKVAEANDTAACQCLEDGFYYDVDGIAIGCSGRAVPSVFTALATLNNTLVGQLRIWDSLIHIVPSDMFATVKPKMLSIERSGVAVLRDKVFSRLGPRLKSLGLKGNILQSLDANMVDGLTRLQSLDLAVNKIDVITAGVLDKTPDLRELYLDNNEITHIEDGAFKALKSLRKLTLSGNKLTNITKDTFAGLESLEVLNLQNNQIGSVDWAAFAGLKKLKTFDIGTNQITDVELRGLEQLEKLFLNNNSIRSLKHVSLRDLPALILISMDRNMVSEIPDGAFSGLARSTRLESLTMAANNITQIGARALVPIQHVSILAMQNNRIQSLNTDGQPYLRPLRRLTTLLVSGNDIKSIDTDDLPRTLVTLAADNNHMQRIESGAFDGISIQRLYINDNQLVFLPRHLFDSFSIDTLEAVDLGNNAWQCVCGEEWLGDWLDSIGEEIDVTNGYHGCIVKPGCGLESSKRLREQQQAENSIQIDWVSVVASLLFAVSLLILLAIAFLYVNDGKQRIVMMRPLSRRVDSDMHKLIAPDADPLLQKDATDAIRRTPGTDKKRVRFDAENE